MTGASPPIDRALAQLALHHENWFAPLPPTRDEYADKIDAAKSVGTATGLLISALHRVGLATLTHTPAPMGFPREICKRPCSERPFVLLPVGDPHPECSVPALARKSLDEISTFVDAV